MNIDKVVKEGMKWSVLAFFGALIIITLIAGCGKHGNQSVIERTYSDGTVLVEIPTEQTYPEENLPANIDRSDVEKIITMSDNSGETESEVAPGPGDPIDSVSGMVAQIKKAINQKPKKHARNNNRIFFMKDGRVLADKEIASNIKSAEKVERSWVWLWWVIGVLAVLMGAAWAVDKFIKPIEIIGRIFRR